MSCCKTIKPDGGKPRQFGSVQAAYENDKVPLDLYLDAQRRVREAESITI